MNSYYKVESTEPVRYVSLDISKARLDYTIAGQKCRQVPNTAAGIATLITLVQPLPGVRVVCEATGGYERRLLEQLHQASVPVCRLQPGRVRNFARAEGTLAKTDKIDVGLIYRYACAMHPRVEKPPLPEVTALRELLDYRRQLVDQGTQTANRLETAGPTLQALLQAQREQQAAALAKADELVAQQVRAHPALRAKAERMQQLQGVGPVLATTLLAYLPELGEEDDKRIAALVGVAPHAHDSGETSRPRHARGGRVEVRNVLYMAAVSASQHNPVLSLFYQRLQAAGKPANVCLLAVMRKMIVVLNRMLKDPHFTLVG
ncbi:IS110 family transposase [Opitutus sp. GAS368]|jgi:transposase|uniref:IS110 family transposase n=1 Tax=Opitutus sp. GAS368 TaxID=1882749 RepID=UPI00087A9CDD|nr:IS110 family transposase [Opitutus sp. GAS368]SDR67956.1 transposase [Opitutus sp. GAS368]SDR70001.1 transposase [Opitutus sp. GAS368]SDS17097.1 transposase [Opitutus sp. GAS368]SDS20140.1 transposase [Opitutus sp. GAS368]SDS23240.1 transposase [Opitutus sp. GAS368]